MLALQCAGASTLLDLTYQGAYGTINNAWFLEIGSGSTGSGVYDAFLQLQELQQDPDTWELGYNSDQGPTPDNPEMGTTAIHNHTVRWSNIPLVRAPRNAAGVSVAAGWFGELRCDINEVISAQKRYISADMLEIWLSEHADLGAPDKYYATWGSLPNTSMIYDFAGAPGLALNGGLNAGSGAGDVSAYIPYELFNDWIMQTGVTDPYVYVRAQYGASTITQLAWRDDKNAFELNGDWGVSDGFDEWGLDTSGTHPAYVPEPSTFVLFGLGIFAVVGIVRRRRDLQPAGENQETPASAPE